ncbi:MAG: hypothetical protein PF481_07410 [Bacteroidales bacterium]|jgi:hypothetical protein|nr:hypothetical protein [Bacteroidales bacterium]
MKNSTYWITYAIETLAPTVFIYFTTKFKNMDTQQYFVLAIFISLIASTIVFQLLYRKKEADFIKLSKLIQNSNDRTEVLRKAINKEHRVIELIMFKYGITEEINSLITQTKKNSELIGIDCKDELILNQRKGIK